MAFGTLAALTSRPDLPWVRTAVGLGSVFDAAVGRSLTSRGLVELNIGSVTLLASDRTLVSGAAVRVRIPAREVILATQVPQGISLHNALAGTVTDVHADPAFDHVMVQLAVGELLLLAEVTRDAVTTMGLAPGIPIQALIKSVSDDVVG